MGILTYIGISSKINVAIFFIFLDACLVLDVFVIIALQKHNCIRSVFDNWLATS